MDATIYLREGSKVRVNKYLLESDPTVGFSVLTFEDEEGNRCSVHVLPGAAMKSLLEKAMSMVSGKSELTEEDHSRIGGFEMSKLRKKGALE